MHHHNMLSVSHAGRVASEGILWPLGGRSMHDPANELPRIPIPRTSVNKIVPGRWKTARNVSGGPSTGPRPLTCCRRGRYVAVEAEEIVRVVAVLELHQTLEVLR